MNLILATQDHLPLVVTLVADCVEDLLQNGIDQWDSEYPSEHVFRENIEDGTLFVVVDDGELVATVCLSEEQEPEYAAVEWRYSVPSLVVHRLCVNPSFAGRGIGTKVMLKAEERARDYGYSSIRLDVYSKNRKAVRLYQRLGYSIAGNVSFRDRTEVFFCMEKEVT